MTGCFTKRYVRIVDVPINESASNRDMLDHNVRKVRYLLSAYRKQRNNGQCAKALHCVRLTPNSISFPSGRS